MTLNQLLWMYSWSSWRWAHGCPKHVEEYNQRNKIIVHKLESKVKHMMTLGDECLLHVQNTLLGIEPRHCSRKWVALLICSDSLQREETRIQQEGNINSLINMTVYYFERILRGSEGTVWSRQVGGCDCSTLVVYTRPALSGRRLWLQYSGCLHAASLVR